MKTQIVYHRGACRHAPENTIASGLAAARLGGDIRSILPSGSPVHQGQRINWGVATNNILAIAPNGDRI
jgi:hypothetical protein